MLFDIDRAMQEPLPQQIPQTAPGIPLFRIIAALFIFNGIVILALIIYSRVSNRESQSNSLPTRTSITGVLPQNKLLGHVIYLQGDTIYRRDVKDDMPLPIVKNVSDAQALYSLSVSPSGRYLIIDQVKTSTVRIFDVATDKYLQDINDKTSQTAIITSLNHDLLAYSVPMGIRLHDLVDGSTKTLSLGKNFLLRSFSPGDGSLLLVQADRKELKLISLNRGNGEIKELYRTSKSKLVGPSLSPDGKSYYVGDGNDLISFNLENPNLREVVASLPHPITSLWPVNRQNQLVAGISVKNIFDQKFYLINPGQRDENLASLELNTSQENINEITSIILTDNFLYFLGRGNSSSQKTLYQYDLLSRQVKVVAPNILAMTFRD